MFALHRFALLIGIVLTLAAAGCAADENQAPAAANDETEHSAETVDNSTTDTPTEPADPDDPRNIVTTTPDGPYVGEWHTKLTPAQAEKLGDVRLAGPFGLTLNDDGTYVMSQSLDGELKGSYAAASGHRLVFSDDQGCDYQSKFSGVGVYRWKVSGDTLTIKNVVPETGGCTGRTDTLTFPVWRR